jgi:predicted acylesterase/phospholipase RssA
MKHFAIACMSGSLKGIFIQGVLTAFEEAGIKADAYASSSSSTVPASYAAIGEIRNQNHGSWADSDDILRQPGKSMSDVILSG